MDEETSRLRALLEELHGELSRLPAAGDEEDAARRTQLLDLKTGIEQRLAHREAGTGEEPAAAPRHESFQERLQTMVASFEGSHPQLASAIEQTMNALSNMGL